MIWLVLTLVFIVIEGSSFNLITIWFALGSLVAFISSYFIDNVWIQTTIFLVVTIVSLLVTKPIIKKYFLNHEEKTNFDRIIGMTGVVTKAIEKHESGRVKVDGKDWMAVSNKAIEKGKEVEILKIDGVKIIVKEKE